jgi:hypothetical protein
MINMETKERRKFGINCIMYGCLSAFPLFQHKSSEHTRPTCQYADLQNAVMVRDGILKLLRSPGIDLKESIPPTYVACRARICKPFKKPRNRFPAWRNRSLGIDSRLHKRLKIRALAGRFDNPIPTRFLALIECSKIPAQNCNRCEFVPPQDVHISQIFI